MTYAEMRNTLANTKEPLVGIRKIWLRNKNLKFIYYVAPTTIASENLRNEAHNVISRLEDFKPDEVMICGHFDMYAEGKIHVGVRFTQLETNDPHWAVMPVDELVRLQSAVYKEVQKH